MNENMGFHFKVSICMLYIYIYIDKYRIYKQMEQLKQNFPAQKICKNWKT